VKVGGIKVGQRDAEQKHAPPRRETRLKETEVEPLENDTTG
jgi:hypothetical protein